MAKIDGSMIKLKPQLKLVLRSPPSVSLAESPKAIPAKRSVLPQMENTLVRPILEATKASECVSSPISASSSKPSMDIADDIAKKPWMPISKKVEQKNSMILSPAPEIPSHSSLKMEDSSVPTKAGIFIRPKTSVPPPCSSPALSSCSSDGSSIDFLPETVMFQFEQLYKPSSLLVMIRNIKRVIREVFGSDTFENTYFTEQGGKVLQYFDSLSLDRAYTYSNVIGKMIGKVTTDQTIIDAFTDYYTERMARVNPEEIIPLQISTGITKRDVLDHWTALNQIRDTLHYGEYQAFVLFSFYIHMPYIPYIKLKNMKIVQAMNDTVLRGDRIELGNHRMVMGSKVMELHPLLEVILERWVGMNSHYPDHYLCVKRNGLPISETNISTLFKEIKISKGGREYPMNQTFWKTF